jgi:hypothetical protein
MGIESVLCNRLIFKGIVSWDFDGVFYDFIVVSMLGMFRFTFFYFNFMFYI